MRAEMSKTPSRAPPSQLHLPAGFRFCPTDEELVVHYLAKKAAFHPFSVPVIAEVELYKFDPWDLPDKALFGEKEWYFFSPRDRKYPNGSRPNRAAGSGYWKATGTDKPISSLDGGKKVGVKKALVFYGGKAPKGEKTNWIMHEYRLAETSSKPGKRKESLRMDDWVLCRIYKKSSNGPKSAKQCSDDDSSLEEILDSLPAIDQSKLAITIPKSDFEYELKAEEQSLRMSDNSEAQKPDCSEVTELREEKMPPADVAEHTEEIFWDFSCDDRVCEESSQGTDSSQELSHLSHENLRQQYSVPHCKVEEDAVDSQFSSLQSFPSEDRNFPHSLFAFDSLLSPNAGRFEQLTPFTDVEFLNFGL